ncbi:Inner membrane ABC transporter permease protein ytfT [Pluralibacter gergoviae]|nr:Inner membrane ABC transporter permease protein ytfT [Pluralibacter gergoviae]
MFIEAVGINIRAAKNAGVNTRLVVMLSYVLSGVCAAIAGVIVAADIRGADANNAGLWLELDAILAVVIGGGSLMGGRFNMLLSVVGALIIQGMNTGIPALRLPAGAESGGEGGGGALRAGGAVAAFYRAVKKRAGPC